MATRDEIGQAVERLIMGAPAPDIVTGYHNLVATVVDVLVANVPAVCPSGFDWTAGDIEQWLRDVKEGRA